MEQHSSVMLSKRIMKEVKKKQHNNDIYQFILFVHTFSLLFFIQFNVLYEKEKRNVSWKLINEIIIIYEEVTFLIFPTT